MGTSLPDHVRNDPDSLEAALHKHVDEIHKSDHPDKPGEVNKFFKRPHAYVDKHKGLWGWIKYIFWTIVSLIIEFFFWIADFIFNKKNNVYLHSLGWRRCTHLASSR